MVRLMYRKIGRHEWIAGLHSIDTRAGGGGVRWYELKVDRKREPQLYQQGTYEPGGFYRWMPGLAIDRKGGIGIATPLEARLSWLRARPLKPTPSDGRTTPPPRWTPSDHCTLWYVGDYIKSAGASYSTPHWRLPPSRLLSKH